MQDVCRMEVLEATKQVVHNSGNMLRLKEDGRLDDLLQVTLGQAEHDVDSVEVLEIPWLDQVEKFDNEGVSYLSQKMELTKDALAVNLVLEHTSHLLDGDLFACWLVNGGADSTVTTLAEKLDALVVSTDVPVSKAIDSKTLSLHNC